MRATRNAPNVEALKLLDTCVTLGRMSYGGPSLTAETVLSVMDKPDVDVIEGLSPAIAIEQKSTSHNPRSTVGTVTESTTTCACCLRA